MRHSEQLASSEVLVYRGSEGRERGVQSAEVGQGTHGEKMTVAGEERVQLGPDAETCECQERGCFVQGQMVVMETIEGAPTMC